MNSGVMPIEDMQSVLNDLLEMEQAKKNRAVMSEDSFKEWVYKILKVFFANLGYEIQTFIEFWKDVGISISSGFADGREQARHEAELRRRIRKKRYE